MVEEASVRGEISVGERLKYIRKAKGLSQRGLAQETGMTHRTVALIERDEISPSVGTLKKIVNGLSLTLAEFFEGTESEPDSDIFFAADELVEIGDRHDVSYRQVGRTLTGKNMLILHERYAGGADTGVAYEHAAQEGGVIIKGHIKVIVGDRSSVLGPGDAYYFDSRIPHRFVNLFDDECEIVSAITPPSF